VTFQGRRTEDVSVVKEATLKAASSLAVSFTSTDKMPLSGIDSPDCDMWFSRPADKGFVSFLIMHLIKHLPHTSQIEIEGENKTASRQTSSLKVFHREVSNM
jgi:hypothetical protein